MTNKNIPLERALMQLADIQAYVESLDNVEDHSMRSMQSSIRSLRALVKFNGGHPMYDAVKTFFDEHTVDYSITDCGDFYVPTMESDDEPSI